LTRNPNPKSLAAARLAQALGIPIMTSGMYNALNWALIGATVLALLLAVAYLVAAIWGWWGPHRKRRLATFAIFLVAFPVLATTQRALFFRVFGPSVRREQELRRTEYADVASFVGVGDAAPAFRLTDTNGVEFALDAQRGNVVLVNFFATWCAPCLHELPHLQRIWDENRGNGKFAMIVIGREETNEAVAEFQSKHGYSFPMAADPERSVYSLYAKELIPRTYLVSPDGKIRFTSTGFYEEEMARLQRELDKQLRLTR